MLNNYAIYGFIKSMYRQGIKIALSKVFFDLAFPLLLSQRFVKSSLCVLA